MRPGVLYQLRTAEVKEKTGPPHASYTKAPEAFIKHKQERSTESVLSCTTNSRPPCLSVVWRRKGAWVLVWSCPPLLLAGHAQFLLEPLSILWKPLLKWGEVLATGWGEALLSALGLRLHQPNTPCSGRDSSLVRRGGKNNHLKDLSYSSSFHFTFFFPLTLFWEGNLWHLSSLIFLSLFFVNHAPRLCCDNSQSRNDFISSTEKIFFCF